MKIPFSNFFLFSCEECQNKGKKVAAVSLIAGVALGAGVLFFVKRK